MYFEDVVTFPEIPQAHIQHVHKVVALLRDAGIAHKLKKFKFFTETIDILDHIIRLKRVEIWSRDGRFRRTENSHQPHRTPILLEIVQRLQTTRPKLCLPFDATQQEVAESLASYVWPTQRWETEVCALAKGTADMALRFGVAQQQ